MQNKKRIFGVILVLSVFFIILFIKTSSSEIQTTFNSSRTDLCYQNTSNVSSSCGGLATGNYSYDQNISNFGNCFNEVWDDSCYLSGATGNIYINYTKPTGALNSSLWMYANSLTTGSNLSITSCFNAYPDKISFKIAIADNIVDFGSINYCWNGTGWQNLTSWSDDPSFSEEAMWWNISSIETSKNFSGTGSWTNLAYISLPKYANVTSATINLTGFYNSSQIESTNYTQIYNDNTGINDSYVCQCVRNCVSCQGTNYGTDTTLEFGADSVPSGAFYYRSLLYFNISSLPSNIYVKNSYMTVYIEKYDLPAPNNNFDVYYVNGSWTESGVTWNNQPTLGDLILDSSLSGQSIYLNISTTNVLNNWINGTKPNYGVYFYGREVDSQDNTGQYFSSSESATTGQRPNLTIIYSYYIFPSNVTLDVSNDGDVEFNQTSSFQTTNQTSNFASEINTYLSTCTANATGWCDVPLNISGANGIVQLNNINITYTESPRVNITYPLNTTYSATVTQLNYTSSDASGLSQCWYSLNGGTTNTTITCGQNVTSLNSGEGFFNWTVWSNDTNGNINFSKVFFTVAFAPPTTTLDYPTNNLFLATTQNINFNFTSTDPNGLSTCELWYNTTGTWHKNETFTSVTSGVQINTKKNLTDGRYIYNAWCNDTTNSGTFAISNYTFTIDTTKPFIDSSNIDITTPTGSQTISFNVTSYTELYCNQSWYSVYDSTGTIENSIENVSLASCSLLNSSFTVNDVPANNYTLRVYMNDSAGNMNFTDKNFTTIAVASNVTIIGGGGGGTTIIENQVAIADLNVSITTINFKDLIDVSLAKDSVKPRKKEFLITNKGIEPVEVKVVCDTQNTNESTKNVSICDYITFEQDTFTVSPNEQEPSRGTFEILTPPNSSIGDVQFFNLLTTRISDDQPLYSKLSASGRVTILGILYKWSYVPFQDENKEDKISYPVWTIALFLAFLVFALIFFIFKARKYQTTGFFLGFISMIASFVIFLIFF